MIESVQAQTFTDYEHIIIDDGSTDNSPVLLEKFASNDSRIRIVRQDNKGRSAARNAGIELAIGEYVCFLDSDDTWNGRYLLNLHKAIETHSSSFLSTRMIWTSAQSDTRIPRPCKSFDFENLQRVLELELGMNVCASRSLFSNNLFNITLSMNEDYDLWTRIICQNSLEVVAVAESEYYASTEEPFGRFDSSSINGMFHAQRVMKKGGCVRKAIPKQFWANRIKGLRLNKVRALRLEDKRWSFLMSSILFVLRYPAEKVVPSLIVAAIYGLPGGGLIKRVVKIMKGSSR
jgi:glycosyltransferase involved in cell wall biosynthesis